MSAKQSSISVFLGATLAFAVVEGISALLGGALATLLPMSWISFGSGLVSILFAIYTLISGNDEEVKTKDRCFPPWFSCLESLS